jgi:phosphopantetheinyl transferase (holo-ACP synthase)
MDEIDHLRELMDERDRRYQERFEASQKALEAALTSADRAVQAALLAAKEAVIKAELSADKRFELLNELRTGVATTEQIEALEKVVADLSKRSDQREGRGAGVGAVYGWVIAAIGAIGAIVAIIATR